MVVEARTTGPFPFHPDDPLQPLPRRHRGKTPGRKPRQPGEPPGKRPKREKQPKPRRQRGPRRGK